MEAATVTTAALASAATGIGMGEGTTFSDIQHIYTLILGHDVWTHELADRELGKKVRAELMLRYPRLPSEEEARAGHVAALARAVEAYGQEVVITPAALVERTEDPLESFERIAGSKPTVVIVT